MRRAARSGSNINYHHADNSVMIRTNRALVALAVAALAACDPVLLTAGNDRPPGDVVPLSPPSAATSETFAGHSADNSVSIGSGGSVASASGVGSTLSVDLAIKSVDCGKCFVLTARALGGMPPYRYEWDDGSTSESRHVCVTAGETAVSVLATDSADSRSSLSSTNLQTDAEAADLCTETQAPTTLCLQNPSFEGAAAINTSQVFDATPWSGCTDAATSGVANTPDIASNTLDPVLGIAPAPTDGLTYLALIATEQASQQLCAAVPAGSPTSLRLDAMSFDLGGPEVFLQVWGGESSRCSRRQLLWTSPPLQTTWQSYCLTLEPSEPFDQITLRAEAQVSAAMITTTYLAVDNIVPVAACP